MRQRVSLIVNQYGWALLGVVLLAIGMSYYYSDRAPAPEEYRAVRGPFERTVSVSGRVIAADSVELGFSQGGRIDRVLVEVGEAVEAGDLLAELENDDEHALIAQRKASLMAEEAGLRSLQEGSRPEEIAVSASAVRTAEVALAQATQSLIEEIQDAYRVADDAVRIKADTYITNPRTQPSLSFITSDTVTRTAVENARSHLETLLPRWERDVFILTLESDIDLAFKTAQSNLIAVSTFLADARTVIAKGLPTGTVTSDDLAAYAADTAAARSSVSASVAALTAADTALKSANATLETAKRNFELLSAGATLSSLDQQEARVEVARASLRDAEARLRHTYITAPFPGIVTRVEVEAGEVASAQSPVFSLISEGELEIESFIPEIYIADIQLGDRAGILLDAYGDALPLVARVFSIEPAETVRDGVATYRTLLHFDGEDARVRPGMTASISVTTEERTDTLAIPIGYVRRAGESTVVSVKTPAGIEERIIETGESSSSGLIEIVSGLREGEVVLDTR